MSTKLRTILAWVFGVFIILMGIVDLERQPFGSFLLLVAGALLLPPVAKRLSDRLPNKWRIMLVIILFIIGIRLSPAEQSQQSMIFLNDFQVVTQESTPPPIPEKVTEPKPETKIQEPKPITQNKPTEQPTKLNNNKKVDYGDRETTFIGKSLDPDAFEKALASPTSKFFGINVGRYGIDDPAKFDSLYNPNDGLLIFPEAKAEKITAAALHAAYERNPIEADENYRGKRLEVSGNIGSIEKATFISGMVIGLKTGNSAGMVRCVLKNSEKNKAVKLRKGQFVIVRGEHTKFSASPFDGILGPQYSLQNCTIK